MNTIWLHCRIPKIAIMYIFLLDMYSLELLLRVHYSGIDARIWEQAKLDNPDPTRMLPVPIVGFDELHQRLRLQEQQTTLHQARLDVSRFIVIIAGRPVLCSTSECRGILWMSRMCQGTRVRPMYTSNIDNIGASWNIGESPSANSRYRCF